MCKAVLDVLKRHFKVVLIDEYLTSQMCHNCHNKLIPRIGEPREKYCTHCGCDVDRGINAAMNILKVFLMVTFRLPVLSQPAPSTTCAHSTNS
jgi:transposase